MNSETLIFSEGKAYRCVVLRQAKRGDTYLGNSGEVWTPERPSTGMMPRPGYRHILEEVSPPPFFLREEVEPLRLAADAIMKDKREIPGANPGETPLYELTEFRIDCLRAALATFTPPERFYAANRTQIEDTGHGTFHTVPTGLDTAKVAAALNELSQSEGKNA